jgi:hypothetical protein
MKKHIVMRFTRFIACITAALLICAGLVAGSTTAAQADPYPGTVRTSTAISGKTVIKLGKRAVVKVRVSAAGNPRPRGKVKLTVDPQRGGVTFSLTKAYVGNRVTFRTPTLMKRGAYTLTAKYIPPSGSVFKPSSKSKFIFVKR